LQRAADPLHRALRGLAALGVLEELPHQRFKPTTLGALLSTDGRASLRGAVIARGRLYYQGLTGLLDAVRDGGAAFERVHGTTCFRYLDAHPDARSAFQASMASRSRLEAEALVAAYRFGAFGRIVDVGGGEGVLLAKILAAAPNTRGVLLDRPEASERAHRHLEATAPMGSWEVVTGDFFESIPGGGDLYVLSRVLHDWDDEAALQILATCRRAMRAGAILVLAEALLPKRAQDQPEAIRMDVHMLALFGGARERTAAQYAALLAAARFDLSGSIATQSPSGIAVLEAHAR
jgi:predicted O-methyltransferase YrrM